MPDMQFNWITERFASSDIIDLYFIETGLVDINLTEAEICQTAYYDSVAANTAEGYRGSEVGSTPLGKLVL